jgi:hypothetical protein
MPSLPEAVLTLELSAVTDEGTRTFVIDLMPLRRRQATPTNTEDDELERDLSFVEAGATTTLDGQPFLARDAVRHYIAVRAGERLNGEPGPAIRRLRQLRVLALRLGDEHCADVLFQVIRAVRLIAHGQLPPDADVQCGIDTLGDWEGTTFPELFAS